MTNPHSMFRSTYAQPRDVAEAALLGAVLLDENRIDTITNEGIRPDHFRYTPYRALFTAMLALRETGGAIDALTLKARFDSPQSPVSAVDIDVLTGAVPNLGNLRGYCKIVRDGAWFDTARRAVYEAHEAVEQQDRDAFHAALATIDPADTDEHATDPADEFWDWYESDTKGWPLPFPMLTVAIGGGMFPGETTVLGSWSGFGKTFLLSQILRGVVSRGGRVLEFASEMHGPKRTARTLVSMTGVPRHLIENKKLEGNDMTLVKRALGNLPYSTLASNGRSVDWYCQMIRRHKPDVAAIDTASNLPCSRIDEWDRAATMLADVCAQVGTHLIQVFQLNLERDKGKRPAPVARDLRFGGTFYHRARNVIFLHRDQESKETGDQDPLWVPTAHGHIRVDKATHGDGDLENAFLAVRFNSKWLRFDELDTYHLAAA